MDLGKIGYRVGIDDAEYYRKLKAVEQSTGASTERMGGMFSRLAGMIGLLSAAWAGWTEARRYASELANIKSIASELDLSKLRNDISSLDSVLGKSSEIANGVYFAYSAGVRGTEKELVDFTAEIAKLAKTIGGGVTPVMDAATTMMNAYGLTVKDTGKLTDWFYQIVKSGKTTGPELAQSLGQIAATAAASKVPLEQLGAALATLTTTMPTNIAVTSLAASLRALMNPTDETATLAKDLGIQMDAAALKTKGLGGVMDEIYRKTGGNGDLIAKLFPAESSRAVIALAGTQLGTFKTNIVDFSNNAGAAAAGFSARVNNMDDDLNALWVTTLKVTSSLGKFAYDVVQPIVKLLGSMSSGAIETIASLTGIAAAMVLVKKAAEGMSALRAGFVALAVRGGYQTGEMRQQAAEAAAAEAKFAREAKYSAFREAVAARDELLAKQKIQSEAAKALAVAESEAASTIARQRSAAVSEALAARKLMLDKQEIASAAAKALAVERANLAMLRSQNETARLQYVLATGSSVGYKPDPALAASGARAAQLQTAYVAAQKEAAAASVAATNARTAAIAAGKMEVAQTEQAIRAQARYAAATEAVAKAENTATASRARLTAATAASAEATTAATTAEAAAGKVNILTRSWRMLNAAVIAHPFIAVFAVMLAGFAVIRSMVNRFEDDLASLQEKAQKLTQNNSSKLEAGDTQRRADMDKIERLKALQAQQSLTSKEIDEARGLIFSLTGRYGDFGVVVDGVTGKITGQADAFGSLNKKMEENRKLELRRVLEAKKSELELIKNKVSTKGTLWSQLTHPIDTLGAIFSDNSDFKNQLDEMVNKGKDLQAEIAAMQLELDLGGGGATPPKPGTETPNTGADVNRRAKQEAELELDLLRKQNELARDGELSKRDELELLQTEIELQKKRVEYMTEAANVAKAIKGDGSKEHLEALTEQEKAQGRLYELERKRTEQSREYARDQAEIARSIAFAELTAKAWQDGQLTHAEKVKLAEQSIADQKARVLRYQNELDTAATEDERNAARKALADAQTTLGQLLGDMRNLQGGNGMAAGSFSTEVLNGLLGANDTEKQIAGDVRTIAREFNRYRNGRTNEIKGLGE